MGLAPIYKWRLNVWKIIIVEGILRVGLGCTRQSIKFWTSSFKSLYDSRFNKGRLVEFHLLNPHDTLISVVLSIIEETLVLQVLTILRCHKKKGQLICFWMFFGKRIYHFKSAVGYFDSAWVTMLKIRGLNVTF